MAETQASELGDARAISIIATGPSNTGRKAGNIQDFCENWGQLYDYMVILDADSLMTGKTLTQSGRADGCQSPRRR